MQFFQEQLRFSTIVTIIVSCIRNVALNSNSTIMERRASHYDITW